MRWSRKVIKMRKCQLTYAIVLTEAGAMQSSTRYYVKYLGSVEVKHHKGNDVLSHAIHKVGLS